MTTITAPLENPPEMPSLKKDHPEYGTCRHCLQAKRITKAGWLPEHNTPYMVHSPSIKAAFKCPGSGRRYAEFGDEPQFWNLRDARWQNFPLELPVIVRSHPDDGITEPTWRLIEVHSTPPRRRALDELIKNDRFRIELEVSGKEAYGVLFALGSSETDGATGAVFEAHARQASIFDNPVCEVGNQLVDALFVRIDQEV